MRLRLVEMRTGCILHVIHVTETIMKRAGIDGLSWGDLLEGMMTVQKPLDFIQLNESADESSGGQVVSWITSWQKDRTEAAWGRRALKKLVPGDWFQLLTQYRPRLWTPPPAVMETVVEVFNEDLLAHPNTPHVFDIPRLITRLQRKQ